LSWNADGVLADPLLRGHVLPVSTFTVDWMHCVLSNGVFAVEIFLFLKACKQCLDLSWSDVDNMVSSQRCFPKARNLSGRALKGIFSATRANASSSSESVKFGASELLSVYSLVRHLAELHFSHQPNLQREYASFLAACDVVDGIQRAKKGRGDADAIARAMQCHVRLHREAYGDDYIIPMHHFMHHVPPQLRRDGICIDAFVVERKHCKVKACASPVRNTSCYEKTILCRCGIEQDRALSTLHVGDALRGESCDFPELASEMQAKSARVSESLVVRGSTHSRGDAVLHAGGAGFVEAAADLDSRLHLLVSTLLLSTRLTAHSARWTRVADVGLEVWPAENVTQVVCWYVDDDGAVVILEC
jgi:hypothetical protein